MQNDVGGYFLLVLDSGPVEYDNAEAARKAARKDELSNPNGTRQLFKMLPDHDPMEIMV